MLYIPLFEKKKNLTRKGGKQNINGEEFWIGKKRYASDTILHYHNRFL